MALLDSEAMRSKTFCSSEKLIAQQEIRQSSVGLMCGLDILIRYESLAMQSEEGNSGLIFAVLVSRQSTK